MTGRAAGQRGAISAYRGVPCKALGVVMGWLLFAIAMGALVKGPAGALTAALLFVGAVFGIKGIRG